MKLLYRSSQYFLTWGWQSIQQSVQLLKLLSLPYDIQINACTSSVTVQWCCLALPLCMHRKRQHQQSVADPFGALLRRRKRQRKAPGEAAPNWALFSLLSYMCLISIFCHFKSFISKGNLIHSKKIWIRIIIHTSEKSNYHRLHNLPFLVIMKSSFIFS